jgi:23S rRNA (cytidine2498-2'-O)-methyltransferase
MRFVQGKVYHAARGFLSHLLEEVPDYSRIDGELVSHWTESPAAAPQTSAVPYWVRNVWEEPFLLEFDSISQAVRHLKSMQRNWAPCPTALHRRTALIAEQLPPFPQKPKPFPFTIPQAPMGAFTLLDEHTLMGSARCSSPFPNGEFEFEENHIDPPSRAYRKLWEALVLAGVLPGPGMRCLDAGASPGGWTWALASLGAEVIAVDRAALDERVAGMPGVSCLRHDAFTLKPEEIGPVDWLCSDVICYPNALFDWVSGWLESGLAKNFVCTIKMQGQKFEKEITDRFAAIPGSRVVHLWHNKHELTWIRTAQEQTSSSSSQKPSS